MGNKPASKYIRHGLPPHLRPSPRAGPWESESRHTSASLHQPEQLRTTERV
ncbi:hypothetical protein ACSS6W_004406 [Trichoderma asperelloides]